jgi:adenosylcobinamide-GDP ribazoletransferase
VATSYKHPDVVDIPGALSARWRDLRLAASFLTCLPIGPRTAPLAEPSPSGAEGTAAVPSPAAHGLGDLARSTALFPLVGAGIGLISALALLMSFELGLDPLACALLALATGAAITGALHEDGAADFADGLGGGHSPESRLAIMRDSRIGSFGTLALIFSVLLRVAALASLADIGIVIAALVGGHAASRAAMTVVMHALPNARSDGLSAGVGRPDRLAAGIGLAVAAIAALVLLQGAGLLAIIIAAGAAAGVAWLAQRQIGGQTGDVLGAAEQIAQAAFLAGLTLAL